MAKKLGIGFILLLLVLILARFTTQTYARMLTNSNSSDGDQGAYLQLSLDMREHGKLTDGTRNPLYPAVLAPLAYRDWAFFTWSKLVSMAFGLLAILALFLLGTRHFGLFAGFVAAYLLSINVEFIVHSATALTESLLVFLFVAAWFAMIAALKNPHPAKYWVAAGVLVGFAYLAKGSGQLLAFAFVAVAFLLFRLKLLKMKGFWLFIGTYMLVAMPLWIYNTYHFGSPTFNYAITHQMWMNSWSDWHPDDTENLPTLTTYLQNHAPAEIIERQWEGMRAMRNLTIKTLWPTRTLMVDRFLLSPISGFVLALPAVLPFIFWPATKRYLRRNGPAVYLLLTVFTLFFMLFSWYVPIVALGNRFILPVIPLIFLLPAHIVGQIGQKIMGFGRWGKPLVLATLAVIVAMQLWWAFRTSREPMQAMLTTSVFEQDRQFNADAAVPLEWLVTQHPAGSTVAWGPPGKSLPAWAYSDRLLFKRYPPAVENLAQLTENFLKRGVDYVIVSADMSSRYEAPLSEIFSSNGTQISFDTPPAGWAISYGHRNMPCEWCVFRLMQNNPPQNPANYQVDNTISLIGFDMRQTKLKAGDTLNVTLHWNAQSSIEQNYTVFTQLLGPDFQLHGQLDNQPVNNLWPTTRWQPGETIADSYAIPINPQAPPGSYQLLVGMYNAETGERLPITQNGQPVPDNAIRLVKIMVNQ